MDAVKTSTFDWLLLKVMAVFSRVGAREKPELLLRAF